MATITLTEWARYRDLVRRLGETASNEFRDHFFKNGGGLAGVTRQEVIDYSYALVTKYGEGASEIACQMYDAIASLEGAIVPDAVPAPTATYNETAKAINGCLKQSETGQLLESVIYRLVKQAAADTTLQNAVRDGAEWAWIPRGDTCAFCLTLASRGWQYASKKMLKNGHAEHIHAHCDCQFAVRFGDLDIEGYNPDELKDLYNSYDGKPQDRINEMRRDHYQLNKDKINEQKRNAYAIRNGLNEGE